MVLPPHAHPESTDHQDPFMDNRFDRPIMHKWREATPFLADMAPFLALGLASWLLGAFLHQLWLTLPVGDALATTASWFAWIGQAAIAGVLVVASLRPSPATPAIRVALLAIGMFVLLGLTGRGLAPVFA